MTDVYVNAHDFNFSNTDIDSTFAKKYAILVVADTSFCTENINVKDSQGGWAKAILVNFKEIWSLEAL